MTPPLFWLFWTVLVKIGLRFWIKLRFRSLGLIFKSLGLIYGPNYICIYATMFLGCLGLLWNFQRKKLRKKMNRPLLEPQLKSLNPFLQFRRPIFQGLILMAQNFIVLTHLNIKFCIIQATYIFIVYHYCLARGLFSQFNYHPVPPELFSRTLHISSLHFAFLRSSLNKDCVKSKWNWVLAARWEGPKIPTHFKGEPNSRSRRSGRLPRIPVKSEQDLALSPLLRSPNTHCSQSTRLQRYTISLFSRSIGFFKRIPQVVKMYLQLAKAKHLIVQF